LNKPERKLLKLQTKAQDCVSRDKAVKIIKKSEKWYEKAGTTTYEPYGGDNTFI
tara:strand:- start:140 stop:301 length:162 start_codon:yes stop_codon:yes gene_type:complete